MGDSTYVLLGRQQGLLKELQVVANNVANSSTTGFRRSEGIFAEYMKARGMTEESLSMGTLAGHSISLEQGALKQTGGSFDLAVEGDGFFLVETPQGERLTRDGHFQINIENTLVDARGNPVLAEGSSPITFPENPENIQIARDGTVSVGGAPIARIALVDADATDLEHAGNNYLVARNGYEPLTEGRVLQGFLEGSNVVPVSEIARLIEVQRAYEAGQTLLEKENERISQVIRTIRQA